MAKHRFLSIFNYLYIKKGFVTNELNVIYIIIGIYQKLKLMYFYKYTLIVSIIMLRKLSTVHSNNFKHVNLAVFCVQLKAQTLLIKMKMDTLFCLVKTDTSQHIGCNVWVSLQLYASCIVT